MCKFYGIPIRYGISLGTFTAPWGSTRTYLGTRCSPSIAPVGVEAFSSNNISARQRAGQLQYPVSSDSVVFDSNVHQMSIPWECVSGVR